MKRKQKPKKTNTKTQKKPEQAVVTVGLSSVVRRPWLEKTLIIRQKSVILPTAAKSYELNYVENTVSFRKISVIFLKNNKSFMKTLYLSCTPSNFHENDKISWKLNFSWELRIFHESFIQLDQMIKLHTFSIKKNKP